MKQATAYILAWLLSVCLQAQTNDSTKALPTDIYASYVVVTPGQGFTSMLGHAAIRMYCPSAGLDYCFTVKSPEIGNEFVAMTVRSLHAGLVPEPTPQFCQDYTDEGRGISEYRLSLTVEEARRLWQLLDDEVALGLHRRVDYIRRGCAQDMFSFVQAVVAPRNIDFDSIANSLLPFSSRRQILSRYMDTSRWKGFIGHSLYGGTPDELVQGADKLIMPLDVAAALTQAGLAAEPKLVVRQTVADTSPAFTPFMFAVVFLLLCLIPVSVPIVSTLCSTVYFLVGVLIVWIVFVSRTPGTEWNWLIIAFNPIPLVVQKWAGRRTYQFYALVLLALLVFMAANLGRLFFVEQLLCVAGLFVRIIYKLYNINLLKQPKV